ncbi:hypothetical protein FF1_016149 [Malus domestica]
MFKSACPRSYSYAYNDVTSTFTCSGADYIITFCPSTASQKSARDTSPTRSTTNNGSGVTTTTSTVNNGRGSGGGSGTTAGELPAVAGNNIRHGYQTFGWRGSSAAAKENKLCRNCKLW